MKQTCTTLKVSQHSGGNMLIHLVSSSWAPQNLIIVKGLNFKNRKIYLQLLSYFTTGDTSADVELTVPRNGKI